MSALGVKVVLLQAEVAELRAERDAAFKRGWEAAKAKAVEAVMEAMCVGPAQPREVAIIAIRAIGLGEKG